MKKLSKLLALLLALAMMFSLAACDSKDKDDKDDDKKSVSTTSPAAPETNPVGVPETIPPTVPTPAAPTIIGDWEYKMDIGEVMDLYMEAVLGTDALAPDAELNMIIALSFADNGEAEMIVDVDKDEFKTYVAALCEKMLDYLYTSLEAQGVSKDEADAQIYQQYGMTTSEYVDAVMDAAMEQALGQFPLTNKMYYKLDEEAGVIYTAETEAGLNENAEALVYKLDDEQLTIENVLMNGEPTENPLAAFGLELPWVFEKR